MRALLVLALLLGCTQPPEPPPEVVLIGNSITRRGIDAERLADLTGARVRKIAKGGSASAWWYLALKNQAGAPDVVIITFRDQALTEPRFRVTGPYREMLKRLRQDHEPLLDHLVDYDDPDTWTATTPWETRQTGEATRPFHEALEDSFLPAMVRIARDRGIRLVFARARRLSDVTEPEPQALARYASELRTWLGVHGAILVDFTHDERLGAPAFVPGEGDHPTTFGQLVMTDTLALAVRGTLN